MSVVDVSFAHDTKRNLPGHILSNATMPCQILFYADSNIYIIVNKISHLTRIYV